MISIICRVTAEPRHAQFSGQAAWVHHLVHLIHVLFEFNLQQGETCETGQDPCWKPLELEEPEEPWHRQECALQARCDLRMVQKCRQHYQIVDKSIEQWWIAVWVPKMPKCAKSGWTKTASTSTCSSGAPPNHLCKKHVICLHQQSCQIWVQPKKHAVRNDEGTAFIKALSWWISCGKQLEIINGND